MKPMDGVLFKGKVKKMNQRRRMIGGPVVVMVKKNGKLVKTQDRTELKEVCDLLEDMTRKPSGNKVMTGLPNHRR